MDEWRYIYGSGNGLVPSDGKLGSSRAVKIIKYIVTAFLILLPLGAVALLATVFSLSEEVSFTLRILSGFVSTLVFLWRL